MHPTGDIGEGDALIDPVLEEGDGSVASVVQDTEPSGHLLALTPVSKDCARLEPILVN